MKIAFVNNVAQMGGAQKVTLDIVRSLPADWDVHVIAGDCQDSIEFVTAFSNAGAKPILLKELKREICFSDIKAFVELYLLFSNHKYDIVHTNSTKPGIVARVAARFAGVKKIIHTVHGIAFNTSVHPIRRVIYYFIEILATFFGHKHVLVNKFYYKYYKYFVRKKNIKTIYNGFESTELFFPGRNHDELRGKFNVLFLARLDEQKDPLCLIKAIEIIVDKGFINLSVKFAGDGPLYDDCVRYVTEHHLSQYVEFVGWVDNIKKSELYSDADMFCIPSIHEAFGLVFLEASSFELPIISTFVEGIPEVVKNNETGILVAPKNPQSLANAIILLYENVELRRRLGIAARKYSRDNFPLDKMTNSYLELYNE